MIVGVAMVAGWSIASYFWGGNELDHGTVQRTIRDLHQRFDFNRLVFVGDRGMVTDANIRRTVGSTISAPRSPPTQQAQGLTT